MIKFFSKQLKNKKGFTLVELIIAIAILGILSAIAVPQIGKFRVNAAIASHNANVRTLESAANMYIAEGGNPNKTELDKGDLKDYVAEWPEVPAGLPEDTEKVEDGPTTTGSHKYVVTIEEEGNIVVEAKKDESEGKD